MLKIDQITQENQQPAAVLHEALEPLPSRLAQSLDVAQDHHVHGTQIATGQLILGNDRRCQAAAVRRRRQGHLEVARVPAQAGRARFAIDNQDRNLLARLHHDKARIVKFQNIAGQRSLTGFCAQRGSERMQTGRVEFNGKQQRLGRTGLQRLDREFSNLLAIDGDANLTLYRPACAQVRDRIGDLGDLTRADQVRLRCEVRVGQVRGIVIINVVEHQSRMTSDFMCQRFQ